MKHWFPFTDYDFYAYLVAGSFLIALVDFGFHDAEILRKTEWSAVQIAFGVAAAYVTGHLIAAFASIVFEELVAKRIFYSPLVILLGKKKPRKRELLIRKLSSAQYYQPLPAALQEAIEKRSKELLGDDSRSLNQEAIFQIAFANARLNLDCATRIDQFRYLYAFSRNLAFVGAIASSLFLVQLFLLPSKDGWILLFCSFTFTLGMYLRFLKFYSSFIAEPLRHFIVVEK